MGVSCPACKSKRTTIHRCATCPMVKLAEVRSASEAGKLLELVLELDDTINTYKVDWNEIQADQATGLRVLKDEREKYRAEKAEQNRQH